MARIFPSYGCFFLKLNLYVYSSTKHIGYLLSHQVVFPECLPPINYINCKLYTIGRYGNIGEYACAEAAAHLPIPHALRLPEPTKTNKYEGCVPPLCSGPLAALRFGFLGWLLQAECVRYG